ncbi:hypothetical protein DE146DRAFT_477938 [Phaeosphaeria sp. MPI-PUGE-AT-0046c]|nr:hypothetical protein DE146DRAFT_477938 [Phaeosphaeria sp. MPI-PUGE-AT-0046c]
MSSYERSRKAAGSSSDPLHQNQRQASSASQPKYKYERPPTSPYNNTADSLSYVQSHSASHQSQAPPARRMSSQHSARPRNHEVSDDHTSFCSAHDGELRKTGDASVLLDNDDDNSDDDDDDWEMVDRDPPNAKTPTSYFPGTWPTALHDTTIAARQVGAATYSYATALTQSGIGKAGWSIGTALAASGKRSATRLVSWLNRGNVQHELQDAEVWGDERGLYVLEQKEMDSTGEIIGERRKVYKGMEEDGFNVEETRGGGMAESGDEEADVGDDGLVRLFQFDG